MKGAAELVIEILDSPLNGKSGPGWLTAHARSKNARSWKMTIKPSPTVSFTSPW
jgi:hypothetical protein